MELSEVWEAIRVPVMLFAAAGVCIGLARWARLHRRRIEREETARYEAAMWGGHP